MSHLFLRVLEVMAILLWTHFFSQFFELHLILNEFFNWIDLSFSLGVNPFLHRHSPYAERWLLIFLMFYQINGLKIQKKLNNRKISFQNRFTNHLISFSSVLCFWIYSEPLFSAETSLCLCCSSELSFEEKFFLVFGIH